MATSYGAILASNVSVVANQPAITWPGGFAALTITATTYPTNCFLQVQNIDGVWVNIAPATVTSAATTISANSCLSYNLPQGQIRLAMSAGTVSALYASLCIVAFI